MNNNEIEYCSLLKPAFILNSQCASGNGCGGNGQNVGLSQSKIFPENRVNGLRCLESSFDDGRRDPVTNIWWLYCCCAFGPAGAL